VALLSHLEKLSTLEEGDPSVGEDRFPEIQDDIQYLKRLCDLVDRENAAIKSQPTAQDVKLTIVPNDGL
jgi:hypothetical protein